MIAAAHMRLDRKARLTSMILLLAAGTFTKAAAAQAPPSNGGEQRPPVLSISRMDTAIDPRVPNQEPPTAVVSDFRQNQPGDGSLVSLPTFAYVWYDDTNLYVIFNCADDPARVRARLAKRENIEDDDQVSVYLDTFHDRRRAYVFTVNPLGVQRDGILTEGQGTDYSFDAVWRSEGTLTPDGYWVIFAIPFSSLRFSSADAQAWGIALGRSIPRVSEVAYWPYITNRVEGFVNQMASIEGLERVSASQLQLVPYAAFTGARYLDSAVPAFARTLESRVGLDAKLVRDAVTLDVTVNPDFSQVESDDPQVTVNKRFETFFPEKRPFFVENAGFFATPANLLFSRRIADPQFGARLTAKAGGWAVGVLATDDRAPGRIGLAAGPSEETRAAIAAFRIQREIGQESFVGILGTDRELESGFNRVIAADMRLKLSPNWVFTGQAIGSRDNSQERGQVTGRAAEASLARSGRHLSLDASYRVRDPDFKPALGFIPRVDLHETSNWISYLWRPQAGPLFAFGPALTASGLWDYAGNLQEWSATPQLDFYFHRQYGVSLYHTQSFERFAGLEFRKRSSTVSGYSDRWQRVSLNGSFTLGTSPNYSPEVMPFLGDATSASFGITLRPGQRLRLDGIYHYSRLSPPPGFRSGQSGRTDVFTNHIARTRVNYQFTRELSARVILDFDELVTNQALIEQDVSRHVSADVLVTYLVNPFTALHVGYTEHLRNVELDTSPTPTLRVIERATALDARQLFLKLSYRFAP
jgi:hypothetical protein